MIQQPHLDNGVGLDRQRFSTWRRYFLESLNIKFVDAESGWEHYANGNAHYFTKPGGDVLVKYCSDAEMFWRNLKRELAHV